MDTELNCLNRHSFGLMEKMQNYQKDKEWSKYVADAELAIKLCLKIVI